MTRKLHPGSVPCPWLVVAVLAAVIAAADDDRGLRMNQIQIVGSHNSYHAGLSPAEMAILRSQNPAGADSLDYRHAGLSAQLDSGVRQVELDVYGDSQGGLFANPLFLRLAAGKPGALPMPAGWKEAMSKPGFKVLHVADVDFRSHCWTLVGCLQEIREWSQSHPGHLPVYIQIENKIRDGSQPERAGFVRQEPVTAAAMDSLDAEIRSVFRPGEVITPDVVRGSHKTLQEAVLRRGWPKLNQARGKVVFLLDQESVTPLYIEGHPSLRGRMMFTNGKPGPDAADAAFVKVNNPDAAAIADLVRKGYLVRTMTDGGAAAVRSGDTRRRDQGFASGAQILSTDYPYEWKAAGSGYSVAIPAAGTSTNGRKVVARCNPVNAPPKACPAQIAP